MLLVKHLTLQRRSKSPERDRSGQSDSDFAVMQLKTDLRRSEQKVEDLQMEVSTKCLYFPSKTPINGGQYKTIYAPKSMAEMHI